MICVFLIQRQGFFCSRFCIWAKARLLPEGDGGERAEGADSAETASDVPRHPDSIPRRSIPVSTRSSLDQ